ncbi:MAG TPA: protein kinase, partial [Vicinamibacterales bacterium]|nr:protein kinase [Vicinamibacterales bacterium]
MTPERWLQIKAVLDTALDLPDHDRLSYLTRACGPDTSLRREVESLLEAHGRGDVVIEDLAVAFPGAAFAGATEFALSGAADDTYSAHPSHESTERQIGAYRVVREIGHGGMGTVFLAARADEAFRRQVAIKLVSRGPISDDAVQRFQSERQILADLDHPNIARLLDGGTTDDGAPYLVMEYVEGQTITEYCDARSLRTTDRLNLFRDVCAAVEYAHRRRVVHRDIKPGNILVTPDGVPKLLDFGIAKILSPNDGDGQSHQTVQLLTPDYASPEQMTGKPITVTSDIYSLGVLLYELLSGHRPYRVDSRIPTALARAICDEQPEAPSTAIARVEDVPSTTGAGMVRLTPERVSGTRDNPPEKLRRRLAGDLDRIVLMALRKQPERRYRSVEQFSDDIARHMSGLPVVARHDSLVYRGGKFAARHPLATAAALLLTVATLFGAAAFFGTIDVRALAIRAGDVLSRPALAFAKRDWLAIADFDNRTKEDLFDSSLNTALAVSLEQST